jgi:16S rRNA processing protein RimM
VTLVKVGRIGRPHGLRGEVVLDSSDLSPAELLAIHAFTWRGRTGTERPLTLYAARPTHDRKLVHFTGIRNREQASELTLGELWVDDSVLPDPGPGVAYAYQLVGLRVVETDGRELGSIADVVTTGANPIYIVRGERELLIPVIPDVVRKVDLATGVVTVTLPAGLEEL